MSLRKDMNILIGQVEAAGWGVEKNKNGHYRWTNPNGDFFFSSSTPSDWRVLMKIKHDLRRLGYVDQSLQKKKKKVK
jgi:hypothetical protein